MAKAVYRYVGTTQSGFHGHPTYHFSLFGQKIEMDQDLAEEKILSDFPILPDAEFAKAAFTDAELKVSAHKLAEGQAPAAFMDKVRASWSALHDYREAAKAKAAAPVEAPVMVEEATHANV